MTEPQTLPPLFLAARALDRFRSSPTPDYPEVRRTLLAHAQRARTTGQRPSPRRRGEQIHAQDRTPHHCDRQ